MPGFLDSRGVWSAWMGRGQGRGATPGSSPRRGGARPPGFPASLESSGAGQPGGLDPSRLGSRPARSGGAGIPPALRCALGTRRYK